MAVTAATAAPPVPRLLQAARGEALDRPPVWFMRQAGRYMAEYRAIRARHSLLEICALPEVAAEVTLQPIRRFGMDAAILFADILLPLVPMGLDLSFQAGEGPVIANPVRQAADVGRLRPVEPREALAPVLQTLGLVRRELDPQVALVGFAGAPFTVASYAIEGGASRHFVRTKQFMYAQPEAWHRLLGHIAGITGEYLAAQIEAGAQAVQLFDSWVGALSPDDYREFVLPHSRRIFERLRPLGAPTIHFGVGAGGLLELIAGAGGEVIGLDWRTPLAEGWRRLGAGIRLQGNLDPVALLAPLPEVRRRAEAVLADAAGRPGHIFNLGHGLLPETPVEAVEAVIETVHAAGGGRS